MKRLAVVLAVMLLAGASVLPAALAHGDSRIVRHRIQRLDGSVRAFGVYKTTEPHRRLIVTVFIIQNERIIGEKTRRCQGQRCRVQLAVDCNRIAPVYAVIQGDTRKGGHFATWNSRRVVCTR
jgi:hypothetical protein